MGSDYFTFYPPDTRVAVDRYNTTVMNIRFSCGEVYDEYVAYFDGSAQVTFVDLVPSRTKGYRQAFLQTDAARKLSYAIMFKV